MNTEAPRISIKILGVRRQNGYHRVSRKDRKVMRVRAEFGEIVLAEAFMEAWGR